MKAVHRGARLWAKHTDMSYLKFPVADYVQGDAENV
jgi:hypothetical protein